MTSLWGQLEVFLIAVRVNDFTPTKFNCAITPPCVSEYKQGRPRKVCSQFTYILSFLEDLAEFLSRNVFIAWATVGSTITVGITVGTVVVAGSVSKYRISLHVF